MRKIEEEECGDEEEEDKEVEWEMPMLFKWFKDKNLKIIDVVGDSYGSIMKFRNTETDKEYFYAMPFTQSSKEDDHQDDDDGILAQKEEVAKNMIGRASLLSDDPTVAEEQKGNNEKGFIFLLGQGYKPTKNESENIDDPAAYFASKVKHFGCSKKCTFMILKEPENAQEIKDSAG